MSGTVKSFHVNLLCLWLQFFSLQFGMYYVYSTIRLPPLNYVLLLFQKKKELTTMQYA